MRRTRKELSDCDVGVTLLGRRRRTTAHNARVAARTSRAQLSICSDCDVDKTQLSSISSGRKSTLEKLVLSDVIDERARDDSRVVLWGGAWRKLEAINSLFAAR